MGDLDPEVIGQALLAPLGGGVVGARRFVAHHFGADAVFEEPMEDGVDAAYSVSRGREIVRVRGGLPEPELRWALMHETGERYLRKVGYRERDAERMAEAIAAALTMPRGPFEAWARRVGRDFVTLGAAFCVTPTAAALRYGEVMGAPTLVVTPPAVRFRGAAWSWPKGERACRRLALSKARRPGLARATLGNWSRVAVSVA